VLVGLVLQLKHAKAFYSQNKQALFNMGMGTLTCLLSLRLVRKEVCYACVCSTGAGCVAAQRRSSVRLAYVCYVAGSEPHQRGGCRNQGREEGYTACPAAFDVGGVGTAGAG
jgi:hypothetical protein